MPPEGLGVHFAQPDLYEPMHTALLEHQGTLTEEAVRAIAEDVGVDLERILVEMEGPRVAEEIDRNLRLARATRHRRQPTFVIGDALCRSQPLPVLRRRSRPQRAIERLAGSRRTATRVGFRSGFVHEKASGPAEMPGRPPAGRSDPVPASPRRAR